MPAARASRRDEDHLELLLSIGDAPDRGDGAKC